MLCIYNFKFWISAYKFSHIEVYKSICTRLQVDNEFFYAKCQGSPKVAILVQKEVLNANHLCTEENFHSNF